MLLVLAGCKKESDVSGPVTRKTVLTPCYGYRDVSLDVLDDELNVLANCDPQYCDGTSSSALDYTSGYFLHPIAGTDWVFNSDEPVSAGDQDELVAQAKNYAVANNPAGYYVESFTFVPVFYYNWPSAVYQAKMKVWVRYRKCTSGGGGGQG